MTATTHPNAAPKTRNRARAKKETQLASPRASTSRPPLDELSEVQARACDLCADLILNGGAESDVKKLLEGVLRHCWRRKFPESEPRDRIATPQQHAETFTPKWYSDLVRHWPEQRPGPETPMPTTVLEMARTADRVHLRDAFEEFMGDADPEGISFLRRVLELAVSAEESSLPEMFGFVIQSDECWVKTPARFVDQVNRFVALLKGDSEEC